MVLVSLLVSLCYFAIFELNSHQLCHLSGECDVKFETLFSCLVT